MHIKQLVFATAAISAIFWVHGSEPARAADQEFQCSTGYRIFLPNPGPNGVIQTSAMFDRMIFERDGLWLHDDTNIQFEQSDDGGVLVVDGQQIACQPVTQAFVTSVVEPASSRERPLSAQPARVEAQAEPSGTNDRIAPEVVETVERATEATEVAQTAEISNDLIDAVGELAPQIDAVTTTGSLVVVPKPNAQAEPAIPAVTGRSRGGRLRAGPGTDFAAAGAIEAGTPVVIVENVGNNFRGFDWFEIEYGNGQRAYTWGGILCSDGSKADGLFEVCG